MEHPSYKTLKSDFEAVGEIEDRRSRFIAQLAHTESEDDAHAFIAAVRSRHHDARHNVPAWVLSDGRERCSDDGEPSRTAGMPILEVLHGAGLADVCCVVTRYFGGTLLGPGGLVRAYTAATQIALTDAEKNNSLVEMRLVTRVMLSVPYTRYERIRHMVSDFGGKIVRSDFGAEVLLAMDFKSGEEAAFVDALRELGSGDLVPTVEAPRFDTF